MSRGVSASSRSSASTARRGEPASFLSRVKRSSEAQPTMAPSRRTAAVAQWVSVMPRTIIPPILQHRGRILLQRFLHLRLVDLDLDAGALELQQHRHARVTLAPAAVERLRHLHQRQLAQPHRHAELAADGGGEAHVLVRQAQRQARRLVLVLQEIVAEPVVETLATVGGLAPRLPEPPPLGAPPPPPPGALGAARPDRQGPPTRPGTR